MKAMTVGPQPTYMKFGRDYSTRMVATEFGMTEKTIWHPSPQFLRGRGTPVDSPEYQTNRKLRARRNGRATSKTPVK